MLNRIHTILLLSSCMMGGLMTACAAPNDEALAEVDTVASVAQPVAASAGVQDKTPTKKLLKEWTRWIMEQPWSTGPLNDPTGANCALGQEGPTWFLVGTTGGPVTRECTIPAGKQLFFPLVNNWNMFPVEFYPTQESIEESLPDVAAWHEEVYAHTCTLTLRVDGKDVFAGGFDEMVESLYVDVSNPFEVDVYPGDNFMTPYDVAGGPMPSAGAGHYARLKPLSPGDHLLELGGTLCDGEEQWFGTSATYHLHVEE
jgi:hypothetical protein